MATEEEVNRMITGAQIIGHDLAQITEVPLEDRGEALCRIADDVARYIVRYGYLEDGNVGDLFHIVKTLEDAIDFNVRKDFPICYRNIFALMAIVAVMDESQIPDRYKQTLLLNFQLFHVRGVFSQDSIGIFHDEADIARVFPTIWTREGLLVDTAILNPIFDQLGALAVDSRPWVTACVMDVVEVIDIVLTELSSGLRIQGRPVTVITTARTFSSS